MARLSTLYKKARHKFKVDITPIFVNESELTLSYSIVVGGKAVENTYKEFETLETLNSELETLIVKYPKVIVFIGEENIKD